MFVAGHDRVPARVRPVVVMSAPFRFGVVPEARQGPVVAVVMRRTIPLQGDGNARYSSMLIGGVPCSAQHNPHPLHGWMVGRGVIVIS